MEKREYYHDVAVEHIFGQLGAGPDGLSQSEAESRLTREGPNMLAAKPPLSAFVLFLAQFKNPLIYILVFAMGLSFLTGHVSDGVIIAIVIIATNIVGFIQEFKANKALEELNSTIVYKAKVRRDGKTEIVRQEEIVRGDVIEVCPGDIVPADARLFQSNELKASEAILTGESVPSVKFVGDLPTGTPLADRENMLYQGTAVNQGTGLAVVVATGAATEIGRIASMIKDTEELVTPLQKQIGDFGKWLGVFLVAVNFLIFIAGVLMGRPLFEMFMVAVVIVVSAVPEGLIPAMGVILALGMQRLTRKRGLVRKIVSAETLGSVSVICVDKTGTLTEGEMSVDGIVTAARAVNLARSAKGKTEVNGSALAALRIGVISNDAVIDDDDGEGRACALGNVTERALLLAGRRFGLEREALERSERRIAVLPFSSQAKMMATLHDRGDEGPVLYAKGAPEAILPRCAFVLKGGREVPAGEDGLGGIEKEVERLAGSGQRVLAVAYRRADKRSKRVRPEDVSGLVFVGLFSIKDQARPDAKEAIGLCRKAGIRVVMITGDHAQTALAIAKELGLPANRDQVVGGEELDALDDSALGERIGGIAIFARTEPRHKLRIVTLLQAAGETVAMTGDGINDAPALKKADIGVVMGNGTDVAKEVADLVLLDSRFLTITEAVRQGRDTFNNIRKVVVYLFTDCFQELVIIGTAVLANWPLPLTPVQILWIKLVESPLPATSLSFDRSEVDVMKDRPRRRDERLLDRRIKINIAFYALVMDVFALAIFYLYWQVGGDLAKTRTVMFAALGTSTLFLIYAVRVMRRSIFKSDPFSNRYLVAATAFGILLFLAAVYLPFLNRVLGTVPLGVLDWLVIYAYAVLAVLVFETGKAFARLFKPR